MFKEPVQVATFSITLGDCAVEQENAWLMKVLEPVIRKLEKQQNGPLLSKLFCLEI